MDEETEVPEVDVTEDPRPKKASPSEVLAAAPTLHDILARPHIYEEWLSKLKEAANG